MRLWYRVIAQLRSLVLRDRRYRELDEEIRLHIEQETAQNIARGMAPREARRHALRAFGGVDQTKEECREAWGLALVDSLSRDVRYAARRLARDWRFTLPAVLVLALGIGANTAMFSAVNTALFRPLPFADADRLVNIYQNMGEASQPMANSYAAYEDIAGYTDLFAGVVTFTFPLPVRFRQTRESGRGWPSTPRPIMWRCTDWIWRWDAGLLRKRIRPPPGRWRFSGTKHGSTSLGRRLTCSVKQFASTASRSRSSVWAPQGTIAASTPGS